MTKAIWTAGHDCSPFGEAAAVIVTRLWPASAEHVWTLKAQIACGVSEMLRVRPGTAAAAPTAEAVVPAELPAFATVTVWTAGPVPSVCAGPTPARAGLNPMIAIAVIVTARRRTAKPGRG